VASTVVHDASGKPYVLEAVDGRAVRRSVKLGLVGGGKAEILDGVTEGALLLPAAATVVEGGRVRARVAAPTP
jgi:HlyD family secretion protein